jgi:hypothetical protein
LAFQNFQLGNGESYIIRKMHLGGGEEVQDGEKWGDWEEEVRNTYEEEKGRGDNEDGE